jgi:hypothetical protein
MGPQNVLEDPKPFSVWGCHAWLHFFCMMVSSAQFVEGDATNSIFDTFPASLSALT